MGEWLCVNGRLVRQRSHPEIYNPAIAWIAWRVYRHEGYFVEPTAKQTIFLGGLIGLLAVSQYFNVAEALSKLL